MQTTLSLYVASQARMASSVRDIALGMVTALAHSRSQSQKGLCPCRVISQALTTDWSAAAWSPMIRNASRLNKDLSSRKHATISGADA